MADMYCRFGCHINTKAIHDYFSPIQACSAKSLERLRSQQDGLRSLQSQVGYLKDLVHGLMQDAPQTPGGSTEGAQRLQQHAQDTEKEYEAVTEKVRIRVIVHDTEHAWECVIICGTKLLSFTGRQGPIQIETIQNDSLCFSK